MENIFAKMSASFRFLFIWINSEDYESLQQCVETSELFSYWFYTSVSSLMLDKKLLWFWFRIYIWVYIVIALNQNINVSDLKIIFFGFENSLKLPKYWDTVKSSSLGIFKGLNCHWRCLYFHAFDWDKEIHQVSTVFVCLFCICFFILIWFFFKRKPSYQHTVYGSILHL